MRKYMIQACILLGMLVAAIPVMAADLDGAWTGSLATPQGEVPINFTFKTDGAAVTGSMTGPDGASIPITDGKLEGEDISFSATVDIGGMPMIITYKGKMMAGSMDLTMTIFEMPMQLKIKKS